MIRVLFVLALVVACRGESPRSTPPPSPPAVSLAILYSGWEHWIGNDHNPKIDADAPERTRGALQTIQAAIGKAELSRLPAGSQVTVLAYAEQVTTRLPLGPVAGLTPAVFGAQVDYHDNVGNDLTAGVGAAIEALAATPASRKILLVIGDGSDMNADAKPRLAALRERLVAAKIDVTAVVYKARHSDPGVVVTALTEDVIVANSLDSLGQRLGSALAGLAEGKPKPGPLPSDAPPTTSVVFVVSGGELWIGNDKNPKVPDDAPERTPGALLPIQRAVGKADFSRLPVGAQAMVITYADQARTRVPMGPIARLTPDAFGEQADYHGAIGNELVVGVEAAADALARAPTGKRRLVVIGDGSDTNNEVARGQLAKIRKRLDDARVAVTAIVYKSRYSIDETIVGTLTDDVVTVSTLDALEPAVARVLSQLAP